MKRETTRWATIYIIMFLVITIALEIFIVLFSPKISEVINADMPGDLVKYWSMAPWVLGLNHGLRGLITLFWGVIPYCIWIRSDKENSFKAHIGLVSGVLGGIILGISLNLQAITMAICSKGISTYPQLADGYKMLGYWAMTGGGLSDSLYVIADIFFCVWLLTHSHLLSKSGHVILGKLSVAVSLFIITAAMFDWMYLVQGGAMASAHVLQQIGEIIMYILGSSIVIRWNYVDRVNIILKRDI